MGLKRSSFIYSRTYCCNKNRVIQNKITNKSIKDDSQAVYTVGANSYNRDQMVIDVEGFINYGVSTSFGFIPWSNVENISIFVYGLQKFIGVEAKDRDLLLEKLPKYKQALVRCFATTMGSPPITISLGLIKEKPQEMLDLMNEYLDEHQKNEI